MKVLSIILSFYFLGLTVLPCEDEIAHDDTSFQQVVDEANNHSDNADLCSPFCQCHCCHIHVLNMNSFEDDLVFNEISTLIIENESKSGIDIPDTHFQPPRI